MEVHRDCASSDLIEWDFIDWSFHENKVRGMQSRIVEAVKAGRWNKVKTLQNFLVRSLSGKLLAIKRVTESNGRNTPGIDGVIWDKPEKKAKAVKLLTKKGFKPQALRRVMIPKKDGSKRPLGIPTILDRAMQALYLLALDPISETGADGNSYGFRKYRSCADAIEQCFTIFSRKNVSPEWVLEGDIKGCFDNISHQWLLENIPLDKEILGKWLKAGFVFKRKLFPTDSGTPQGRVISPTLANMTLDGLEELLAKRFPAHHRKRVNLVRYADDFIVSGISKEVLENEVKPLIEEFLKERGLVLSEKKTKISHIDDGFDFLGHNVRRYKGKLLIKPSKSSTIRFLRRVKEVLKTHKASSQEEVIRILNPKISGWANFYRHVVSKDTYDYVDHHIWRKLWYWCNRRHPNKGKRWVKQRYFTQVKGRDWRFASDSYNILGIMKHTPIRRHTKVKKGLNPYDRDWWDYTEDREERKNDFIL